MSDIHTDLRPQKYLVENKHGKENHTKITFTFRNSKLDSGIHNSVDYFNEYIFQTRVSHIYFSIHKCMTYHIIVISTIEVAWKNHSRFIKLPNNYIF